MRLLRVRFTVRALMVAVAVVAILLVVSPLRQRWASYRRKAMGHAFLAKENKEKAEISRAAGREHPEIRPFMERSASQWERIAMWHADLAEKYGRAALRPWKTMPPDPLMLMGPVEPPYWSRLTSLPFDPPKPPRKP